MNKNEVITSILDLYEENQELKMKNELMENCMKLIKENQKDENESLNDENLGMSFTLAKNLIEKAKETIFKETLYSSSYIWNEVACWYNDESKTYRFTSFETWCREKIIFNELPTWLSLDEYIKLFNQELKLKYEAEKNESLMKFKEKNEGGEE